ncbi:class I SAM-dependent methyltransferase [Elusimicrobiota bacterium]
MNRQNFFNHHSLAWDGSIEPKAEKRFSKKILPMLDLSKSKNILDLGTGTGIILPYLKMIAAKKADIVALDFSKKMISIAKKKYGNKYEYVIGNAQKLPFKTESFDSIICYSAFPHFTNKLKALKEGFRTLKKKGKYIIAHSDSRRAINSHHRKIGSVVEKDYLPDTDEMRDLFRKAGFTNCKIAESKDIYVAIGHKSLK